MVGRKSGDKKRALAVGREPGCGIRRTPRHSVWQKHSVEREERMNVSSYKAELEAYCKGSYKEFGPHLPLTEARGGG